MQHAAFPSGLRVYRIINERRVSRFKYFLFSFANRNKNKSTKINYEWRNKIKRLAKFIVAAKGGDLF